MTKENKVNAIIKAIKGDPEALFEGGLPEFFVFTQTKDEGDMYSLSSTPGRVYSDEEVDEIERKAHRRNKKSVVIKIKLP